MRGDRPSLFYPKGRGYGSACGRDGECAALRRGNEPPFSFRLAEKKTAVHGQKKRRLRAKSASTGCLFARYGGRASRFRHRCRESSAECASPRLSNQPSAANCGILTTLLGAGRKVSASITALPASSQGRRDIRKRQSRQRLSSRSALPRQTQKNDSTAEAVRSEAERTERNAGQMQFCTRPCNSGSRGCI